MELASQVTTFVITIITGTLLGVLFDFYRVLRGNCNPKTVFTWFTDLLYWLVSTAVIFIALIFSNWGELRFYVFIGILSGVGLYYNLLSRYTICLFSKLLRMISITLGLINKIMIHLLFKPGRYCLRMMSYPILFVQRKITAWYHIRWPTIPDDEKK